MGATTSNYVVISSDCHAGASIAGYKPFLASTYHDEFDAWADGYVNPYQDNTGADADRNWSSERRLREMEEDGVVAEVVFPNTVPPFFPKPSLVHQPPGATDGDLAKRWAGLQAHNRWMADFCGQAPGRRAGIAQIMLHDVDAAVKEIEWAEQNGLTGGILLPGAPPGSGVPPLYAPDYEPIWAACADLGMPVNHHSGSAVPDMGPYAVSQMMFLLEVTWWAHRTLWHLIYSGVMERHPTLQCIFTEQGTAWVPEELARLDYYQGRLSGSAGAEGSQEAKFGAGAIEQLTMSPSEYWARQCHVGASFVRPQEVDMRDAVGVDHIMWGSDFPHLEGCWPYSRQHLRLAFAGVPEDEVRMMVGTNAAALYGFDMDLLEPLADRYGPTVAEVAKPLDPEDIPDDSLRCPVFASARSAGP
jgi:predicted TIM-barrel fold metal-dependent hydrolase